MSTHEAVRNQSMTARLRRVLVRPPDPASLAHWEACGWRERPEPSEAEREHAAFRALLADLGADVVVGRPEGRSTADAVYVCDASLKFGRSGAPVAPSSDIARKYQVPFQPF
jgi:N-dimethylarginine dimethylaminohydrolase